MGNNVIIKSNNGNTKNFHFRFKWDLIYNTNNKTVLEGPALSV